MITSAQLKKAVAGRKVLIDSNIIIYLTDSVNPYQKLAKLLFQMVEAGDAAAVISILSVGEVMQGPINQNQQALALEIKDYLVNFPNCRCQEITLGVLERVGSDKTIEWKGLRTVDSLIIASGLVNGVDLFVSNDRHFRKAIPKPMMLSFD
jgi:predicted nucleic acid-binding protein